MKTILAKVSLVVLAILLTCIATPVTAAPDVRIKLLNKLPMHLAVGESYTIDVRVSSDEPSILAMAMPDAYYPGRGIFFHGSDSAVHATKAVLHLTVTGKDSTADLAAVSNWPTPGENWPAGVAPASVVVGVRLKNGQVVAERFNFAVTVP